jgi:hypothetical protein
MFTALDLADAFENPPRCAAESARCWFDRYLGSVR